MQKSLVSNAFVAREEYTRNVPLTIDLHNITIYLHNDVTIEWMFVY